MCAEDSVRGHETWLQLTGQAGNEFKQRQIVEGMLSCEVQGSVSRADEQEISLGLV